jgi:pimeloyl-ACP methyl ester carboxylesterase
MLALLLVAGSMIPARAADRAASTDEAERIIAEARRIVTPNGIEETQKVQIGGIEQWVSIRGMDRRNPVLIYLHGGPGYVATPQSWYFGRGWEEYFTVVHWDQRASGRTHLLTDPEKVRPTLTAEQAIRDAEELVQLVRKKLGKDKVFVVGHSGGSWVGLNLARRHPEWLHAYVGVGQVVRIMEGEKRAWKFAMDAARRDKNEEAVQQLKRVAPYPKPSAPIDIDDLYTVRKWVAHYGGTMAYRSGNKADSDLVKLSPDYAEEEERRVWEGNGFVTPILLPKMFEHDPAVNKLEVPIFLFSGRYDTNVNSDVGAEWLETVAAPAKGIVWFEHSGHMPMTEEPGKFLVSLVRSLRPIAEKSGDVPR